MESTKSVSDVYAPFAGTVTARNEALDANPEIVNSDPYGEGWLVEIAPAAGVDGALAGDGPAGCRGVRALWWATAALTLDLGLRLGSALSP